ncbi:MAG: hypothetical protein C4581_11230 [Nitrospiraceae bacterium]|nr:MAG: hypothetical protein C4581_11230 [Nitrospiraceae bacterium]
MFKKLSAVTLAIILSASMAFAEKGSLKIGILPAPPNISASVKFTEPSGNNILDAEETGTLTIIISNSGKGDAFDVTAELKADKKTRGFTYNNTVSFGTIPAGKQSSMDIELRAGEDIPTDNIAFSITVKEANGFDADPLKVAFRTKSFEPPSLIIADIGIDDQNGNSSVEQMEIVVEGVDAPKGEIRVAKGLSVDIEQGLPVTKTQNRDAFAVVMGNSEYKYAKNVDFAVNDAQMVKRYLTEVLGFREGNIFILANATKGDLELYFGTKDNFKGKLFNQVKPGRSDIFIYYSGHGAPGLKDRKGYIVPVEADPQYIELSGYPLDVFYSNLSKLPAKSVTVVTDACFSGADIYDSISPIVLEIDNPVINLNNGIVLSSSTGTQVSTWYNEKKHGMFTYFFLKAIHDRNADYDGNRELTFDEIYRYISDRSDGVPYYARSIHNVEQTPVIQGKYQGRVLVTYEEK